MEGLTWRWEFCSPTPPKADPKLEGPSSLKMELRLAYTLVPICWLLCPWADRCCL